MCWVNERFGRVQSAERGGGGVAQRLGEVGWGLGFCELCKNEDI